MVWISAHRIYGYRLLYLHSVARASIEDDYARKMISLCRKPLGSAEAGTLRASLDVMRGEVECMGKAHQFIAHQMKSELEEPLTAFAGGIRERRKIVQSGVEKLFKVKQQQTHTVNKVNTFRYIHISIARTLMESSLETATSKTA